MTKRWVLSVVACTILALASTAAFGQAVFGNIVGTATDPQGAAVANAKVTVTSQTKSTVFNATTNESGNFSVSHLIPDTYKVKFEAPGFKSFEQGDVPVFADSTYRVDCQFAVGSASETLEITGEPPQLQTDKSDIAVEYNNTYVQDLPTFNRNFTEFELLSPGTQKLTGWSHAATENPQGGGQIFVNGQHFSGTNFQLDGTDNQDPILGIIVINPNLDAVTEAKIALQQYDAEMGKAIAGYVTAQTKSGSNDFHGGGFYFRRTGANQARDPFTQYQLVNGRFIPGSKWQEYGGSLGGPIMKNKLFFFGDYQGFTTATGVTNQYSVPTALVHQTCVGPASPNTMCDLSQYLNHAGGGGGGSTNIVTGQLFDPCYNGGPMNVNPNLPCQIPQTNNPTGPGGLLNGTNRAPFVGNLIPNSLISPQAVALLSLFPMPNSGGSNNGTQNNYVNGGSGPYKENAWDGRIDWVASQTLNVFGRYSQQWFSLSGAPGLGQAGGLGFGSGPGLAGSSNIHNYSVSVGATKTLGQSWVADFRFGWMHYNPQTKKFFQGLTPMNNIAGTGLAVPGLNDTTHGAQQLLFTSGYPAFFGDGTLTPWGEGLNVGRCNCPLVEDENQYQGATNWTKVWGNHSFKFGADIRSASNLRIPSDANRTGVITYSKLNTSGGDPLVPDPNNPGQFICPKGSTCAGLGGLDVATFLLGNVTNFQRFVSSSLNASEHQWRYFFYGQDTWRLTPKLTLNIGLRWEIYNPETVNAKGNGGFANPSLLPGGGNGVIRVGGYGPYSLSGNINNNYHAFAPRFGLAYSMNDKTVIRMGFGVSYDIGVFGSNFGHAVTQNLPVLANQTVSASTGNSAASDNYIGAFTLTAGPTALAPIVIPANGVLPLGGPQGNVQPRMRPTKQVLPAVATWNFAIQRQMTNSLTLDIAYIGVEGRHGFTGDGSAYNLNPVNIQNFGLTQANIIPQTARQFYNNLIATPYNGTVVLCCNGGIMGNYFGNNANSNYNALQVKVQQNLNHGLQFIAHYTWSHALAYTGSNTNYFAIAPRVTYGADDQNRPQVFVANIVYMLPFGKGKQFGGNAGTAENLIIGGWQVTGTTNYSSGLPYTASYNECGADEDVGVCNPNKGNSALWSMGGSSLNPLTHTVTFFTPIQNMDTQSNVGANCAVNYGPWGRPCQGTLGNAGVSSLYGPRSFTADASIMKNFALTERFALQFRMDVFNLFNHRVDGSNTINWCVDCMSHTGSLQNNAGLVTDIDPNTTMRALQFALRLSF
jgi:hypothetical protein